MFVQLSNPPKIDKFDFRNCYFGSNEQFEINTNGAIVYHIMVKEIGYFWWCYISINLSVPCIESSYIFNVLFIKLTVFLMTSKCFYLNIGLLVKKFIKMFFQGGSLKVEHDKLSLSILTVGKHISPSNSSYKDITLYINLKYYPFVVCIGLVSVGIRFLYRLC